MQRSEALEIYQKEAYQQDIETYTFSVEAAGATSDERALLKAKKPGINLHFLRYGVFNYEQISELEKDITINSDYRDPILEEDENNIENEDNIEPIKLENVDVATTRKKTKKPNDKLPDLKNCYYQRTILNEGFLYLIEEGADKNWLEYEINEYGILKPVFWKDNIDEENNYKDIRLTNSTTEYDSLTFKEHTVLWVGYSATQFTIPQLNEIKGDISNKEQFLKIECENINKQDAENFDYYQQITSYNRFYASFDPEKKLQSINFNYRLQKIVSAEEAPDPENENNLLEDLFVTLIDPLGCADDLYSLTKKENQWHEALIETLTKAQTPANYYNSSWCGACVEISDVSAEIKDQLSYLFTTTLATYKFVYDDPETEDDYSRNKESWSHGVDKNKILKILNVKGRAIQRARIYKMRDDLGAFFKSKLYQDRLLDYYENIPIRQENGKLHTANHLYMLSLYEGVADRHLNLNKEYKPKQDYWLKLIKGTLAENPKHFKNTTLLLRLKIDTDLVENVVGKPVTTHLSFGKKYVSLAKKVLDAYAMVGTKKGSEFKLLNQKLFYRTVTRNGVTSAFFMSETVDLNSKELKALGKRAPGFTTKNHTFLKVHKEAIEASKDIARRSGPGKKPMIYIDKGVDRLKYGKQLDGFLISPRFLGFLALYEIYSLSMAIINFHEKGANFNTVTSTLGASIKLSSALLNLGKDTSVSKSFDAYAIKKDLKIPKIVKPGTIAIRYQGTAKFMSAAGGGVTVLMCAKDSYIAFAKADYDAAIAQVVAGVASGVLLASQVGLIAQLAFPPTLIISIIGITAFGFYYYFKDSDLEYFFKHYPLSTYNPIGPESDHILPYNYMILLYDKRESFTWPDKDNLLVTISNDKYKNFKTVFVNFMNIVGSGTLRMSGSRELHAPHDQNTYFDAPTVPYKNGMYHPWRSIAVTVHFGAFLRSTEDLEFEFYFVMPEAFNARPYSIPIPNDLIKVSAYFDQKTHVYTAHLWLQIPKKLTVEEEDPSQPIVAMDRSLLKQNMHLDLDQGEIAVLCKLNNVQEQGLPLTNNNEQGYLYSQIPILYRDKATGIVIARSGFTQVVSKKQFLNYYRPKTILE